MTRWFPLSPLLLSVALAACAFIPPGSGLTPRPADSGDIAGGVPDPFSIEPEADGPASAGSVAWPAVGHCARRLDAVLAMPPEQRDGLDRRNTPFALLPLDGIVADTALAGFARELAMPLVDRDSTSGHACILAIGRAEPQLPRSSRKVFRTVRLKSSFPRGMKKRANPEVRQIEKALSEARKDERARRKSAAVATGDPALDLLGHVAGGLIDGISAWFEPSEVEELEARLAATDPFIEEPLMSTYSYTLQELETRREATLRLALVETATGRGWQSRSSIRERRFVALSDDRHPQDHTTRHGPAFTPMTSTELQMWERQAAVPDEAFLSRTVAGWLAMPDQPLRLEDLFFRDTDIAAGTPVPPAPPLMDETPARTPSANDAAIRPAAGHPAETVPARTSPPAWSAGLVKIGEHDGAVAFHVGRDQLIAPADALPASSIVELVYPDGMLVYGLIETTDEESGLARIFSPREAAPLPLDDGPPGDLSAMDAAPAGTPILVDGSVRAIWLGNGMYIPSGRIRTGDSVAGRKSRR